MSTSPRGNYIATCSDDGWVHIYNVDKRKLIIYRRFIQPVHVLLWLPTNVSTVYLFLESSCYNCFHFITILLLLNKLLVLRSELHKVFKNSTFKISSFSYLEGQRYLLLLLLFGCLCKHLIIANKASFAKKKLFELFFKLNYANQCSVYFIPPPNTLMHLDTLIKVLTLLPYLKSKSVNNVYLLLLYSH